MVIDYFKNNWTRNLLNNILNQKLKKTYPNEEKESLLVVKHQIQIIYKNEW